MKKSILKSLIYTLVVITISSCTAGKKIPYLTNAENEIHNSTGIPELRFYKNDQLTIIVNSTTQEATTAFNLMITPNQFSGKTLTMSQSLQTYIVDNDGNITFPVLGKIQANGKTRTELENEIKNKIFPKYLTEEPIVNISIINFSISVLGEVGKPGSFNITNDKVTILEALAKAGDMTLYGRRDNLLLIREDENGKKETIRLNLQDKALLNSDYYYLKQNDVLYVQTNKTKSRASSISSVESLSVSITSTLISLSSLLITILK